MVKPDPFSRSNVLVIEDPLLPLIWRGDVVAGRDDVNVSGLVCLELSRMRKRIKNKKYERLCDVVEEGGDYRKERENLSKEGKKRFWGK